MLGVQRTIKRDEETGTTYLELTQKGCIIDLYEEFKDMVPKRKVSTPMPASTFLSMFNPDSTKRVQPDELTKEIKGKRTPAATMR